MSKRIKLSDNNGTSVPRVGEPIFCVKELPVEANSNSTISKFAVFGETVVETKLFENEKDIRNPKAVQIKTNFDEKEFKTVDLASTLGPRRPNELLVSEDDALVTVRFKNKEELSKARKKLEDARKEVKLLEQICNLYDNMTELDFDTPGQLHTLEFNIE